ncbi:MAG: hypothetical protein KC492_25445, partial [Myxococcales bacterium]|nr:hypothetical protein [Myxococcales bacterium]
MADVGGCEAFAKGRLCIDPPTQHQRFESRALRVTSASSHERFESPALRVTSASSHPAPPAARMGAFFFWGPD